MEAVGAPREVFYVPRAHNTMRCGAAPLCTKRTRILPRYMSQAARGPTVGLLGRRMETWQTLVSLSGRREIDLGRPRDAGRRARGTSSGARERRR